MHSVSELTFEMCLMTSRRQWQWSGGYIRSWMDCVVLRSCVDCSELVNWNSCRWRDFSSCVHSSSMTSGRSTRSRYD